MTNPGWRRNSRTTRRAWWERWQRRERTKRQKGTVQTFSLCSFFWCGLNARTSCINFLHLALFSFFVFSVGLAWCALLLLLLFCYISRCIICKTYRCIDFTCCIKCLSWNMPEFKSLSLFEKEMISQKVQSKKKSFQRELIIMLTIQL